MTDSNKAVVRSDQAKSLVVKMAEKFGVDAEKFMATLKSTAFKQRDGSAPTNEQMMALMVVSDQYGLNPFTKEIYAFPDRNNGIVPVVGVDGWSRIINSHRQFDGIEFRYSDNMVEMTGALSKAPEWIEAVLYRKDRTRPIVVREYLDECYKPPGNFSGPWQTHPKRFLRHKALIQGARIGFGFVGIYDQDEAENIIGATIDNSTGVVSQNTTKAKAPEMTDDQFKTLVHRLIERGKMEGSWPSVHQYLEERFQNNPAMLQQAKQEVNDAELGMLESSKPVQGDDEQPVDEYPDAKFEADVPAEGRAQGDLNIG